ncbi:MAG: hypothetical protein U0802_04910 [Candidatus Binatia bacterium]
MRTPWPRQLASIQPRRRRKTQAAWPVRPITSSPGRWCGNRRRALVAHAGVVERQRLLEDAALLVLIDQRVEQHRALAERIELAARDWENHPDFTAETQRHGDLRVSASLR